MRVEYYGRRDMSETVLRHLAAHRGVRFDVQGVRRPASGYVWECFHNLDGVGLPAGTVLTLADGNERGVMEIERGADSGIVEITKYAWSSSGDLLKVLRYDGDGQFVEGWDLVGEESVSPRLYELLASQNEFLRSGLTLPREFDGATIPTCTAFGDEQT